MKTFDQWLEEKPMVFQIVVNILAWPVVIAVGIGLLLLIETFGA